MEKKSPALNEKVLEKYRNVKKNETFENMVALIQAIGRTNCNATELVAEYGVKLLAKHHSSLTDEFFPIVEETFYAVTEMRLLDWAYLCLQLMKKRLDFSAKYHRSLAVYYEACGKTKEARNTYYEVIKQCPSDSLAYKRLSLLFVG